LADLAVVGGLIAEIAPTIDAPAERVVNACGLVLAPGFIDIHGHSDMTLFVHPGLESKAFQGAWGLSTGLIYPPGSYAATDEPLPSSTGSFTVSGWTRKKRGCWGS
jgi:hypothetical protein